MTHYRICILSIIKQIYEESNEEFYEPISGHIHMNFGDISNNNTITKFKQIHELFNEGYLTLDLEKQFGEKGNANDCVENVNCKAVKQLYEKMFQETFATKQEVQVKKMIIQSPKKPRGKVLRKDNQSSNKLKQSLVKDSKNQERKAKNKNASIFFETDEDFKLKTIWLHNLKQNTRVQTVYDTTDINLYLGKENETVPIATHPKTITESDLNLGGDQC